jgi:hypothetical protein
MTNLTLRAVLLFVCLVLAASWSDLSAADTPNIQGVQVSADARQIMIKGDGPLGKHSAFVISQPYRLVVDFEAAGLGQVPARTKINREPINEIRLGRVNSRSRVVADFGENAVPPFKLHHQGNLVVITFGDAPPATSRVEAGAAPAPVVARASNKPVGSASSTKAPPKAAEKQSGMSMKTSGVKDNLVFVELADRSNPQRVYRLAIDFDLAAQRIKHATLSDNSGAVRRFELAAVNPPPDSQEAKGKPMLGPRRESMAQAAGGTKRTKYHWGLPNVEQREPQVQQFSSGSPFRFYDSQVVTRVSAR